MKNIVSVIGARPQYLKARMVTNEIFAKKNLQEFRIETGQHYSTELINVDKKNLCEPAITYSLNIKQNSHSQFVGEAICQISQILRSVNADAVLLYGDTISTLAGAISAYLSNVRIYHVEGGVRNWDMKIREEFCRIASDLVSDVVFVSTNSAQENLKNDLRYSSGSEVVIIDDLSSDILQHSLKFLEEEQKFDNEEYVLVTLHRDFNLFQDRLKCTLDEINSIAQTNKIYFVTHPNTRKKIKEYGIKLHNNVHILPSVPHAELILMLRDCAYVITDSGGLQREAYMMKKKSLLLLERTPWEELISCGAARLTNSASVHKDFVRLKVQNADFTKRFYGEGRAAKKIVEKIECDLLCVSP